MAGPSPFCRFVNAGLILLPVLAVAGIALPWAGKLSELDTTIADRADQVGRYQRVLASMPGLRAELERIRSDDAYEAFYFRASTQALAGAQLQGQVQEIVTSSEGRLISTQILPENGRDDPPRIVVRTQIQGSTETLLSVLYKIEQARPFLFVDKLSVRSAARPTTTVPQTIRGRPTRRFIVRQDGELTMRIDIFGYVLGGGP